MPSAEASRGARSRQLLPGFLVAALTQMMILEVEAGPWLWVQVKQDQIQGFN